MNRFDSGLSQLVAKPRPFLLKRWPIEHFGVHDTAGALAAGERDHALAGRAADVAEQFVGPGDRVGREEDVIEIAEAMGFDDRLVGETIECRAGDSSLG